MRGARDMSENQERTFERRGVVAGIGALLAAGSVKGDEDHEGQPTPGNAAKSKAIQPQAVKAADASYSPGLLAQGSRVLFVSGQGPRDRSAEMEVQIRQTFEKIQKVLETAGASWRNVAMLRYYSLDLKRDLPIIRKVRREFLKEPYPA